MNNQEKVLQDTINTHFTEDMVFEYEGQSYDIALEDILSLNDEVEDNKALVFLQYRLEAAGLSVSNQFGITIDKDGAIDVSRRDTVENFDYDKSVDPNDFDDDFEQMLFEKLDELTNRFIDKSSRAELMAIYNEEPIQKEESKRINKKRNRP